ncbi:MAG: phosphoribosylamine--glycine ligase [Microbacteriaceae bacterium]|nr:phosphoribosylamine--glycine ligase [Microbacteriaceae bacterium]
MKILVLGSGAREHAIVSKLAAEGAHELIAAPGNVGMTDQAQRIRIDSTDPALVADFAGAEQVDLVVIGPEAPLVAGVADAVRAAGIPVFGPSQAAAALEGSKLFAKDVMERAGVPTGGARLCEDLGELGATLDEFGAPHVVKADGLASGKGVIVTDDRDAAMRHGAQWITSGPMLVEEFLDGQEVSLFCISDGTTVRALPPAQDFKRLGDGDAGPNTGGMGAYTPVPFLDERYGGERAFMREVVEQVAQPVVDAMREADTPFQGLLYCGLIVTDAGLRVIEFNARFGDPETQVVLERLDEPLSALLLASANGSLADHPADLAIADGAAVTVVLAAEGYPERPIGGREITGLDAAVAAGARVLHAGTDLVPVEEPATAEAPEAPAPVEGAAPDETPQPVEAPAPALTREQLVAAGGRVLNVVATGETLADARRTAYIAIERIGLRGGHYRTDIAKAGADAQRAALGLKPDDFAPSAPGERTASAAPAAVGAPAQPGEAAEPADGSAPAATAEPLDSSPAGNGAPPSLADTPIAAATAKERGFNLESTRHPNLPGWRHVYRGKVREVYEAEDDPQVSLIVASNRVSAFDHLLDPEIPAKGALLTKLSRWWFDRLPDVPNHLREPEGWDAELPAEVAERSMRVAKLEMFPVECVVRGYLTGSGLKEYRETGAVCGVALPEGLEDGDRLPEPIYTPAYKAPQGEHDENITYERTVELVGEQVAAALRELSLTIYSKAAAIAEERGVILADTKFEFGRDPETGGIVLADEVLTSDSSRYWDADAYRAEDAPLAERLASFDKQIVRDWLAANWDGEGLPPTLPDEIVDRTRARYEELFTRLGVE